MCALPLVAYFERGFRSFNKGNMGSLDQRATKLQSVKLLQCLEPGRTQTHAWLFEKGRGWMEDFFLETSNFDGW